jgi:hypothetical protein
MEGEMKLQKRELVQALRTMGYPETAARVDASLSDEIDTERDAEVLDAAGLPHERLMGTLAAAGMPRIIG